MWLRILKQDLKSRCGRLLVATMIRQTNIRWITKPTASLNSQMDETWHRLCMQYVYFCFRLCRSNRVRWLGRLRIWYSRAPISTTLYKLLATEGMQRHVPLQAFRDYRVHYVMCVFFCIAAAAEIQTPRPDEESPLKLIDLGSLTEDEWNFDRSMWYYELHAKK